jgi:uncharacterized membrane protein YphA (DoxX/SURF4 family)
MRVLVNILRLLVALLFIVSGLIKVNDITGFAYKLEEYFYVFEARFLPAFRLLVPYALPIGATLTVLEVLLGFLLLLGIGRGFTTFMLLVLIVFFTWLTGYSAVTGSVTDCGCFGDALKLTPWQSFIKDLVLLVMIVLIWANRTHINPAIARPAGQVVYAAIVLLATLGVGWYCYSYLPIIDFRPYKVGSDLAYNTTHRNAEGQLIAKDYFPFKNTCGQDEFSGNVLLIIMYDMEKARPADVEYSIKLAGQLKEANVTVMAGTSTPSAARDSLIKHYNMPYCVAPQDLNMLKTMIRSNPGYILLRNGVVRAQWHANHRPTRADIFRKLE